MLLIIYQFILVTYFFNHTITGYFATIILN